MLKFCSHYYYYFFAPIIMFFKACDNCGSIVILNNTSPVFWGHVSILEADLRCFNQLFKENKGMYQSNLGSASAT